MDKLGEALGAHEKKHRESLANLRSARTIVGAVDHGGEHRAARFRSTSILVADLDRCAAWESLRIATRRRWLADGRRMSYKRLGDRVRQRAPPSFLAAANSIPGVLFTMLTDKQVPSVFEEIRSAGTRAFAGASWPPRVFDRMLLTIHFSSFLLGGLSAPGQDVLLLLDEDDMVANETMHRAFCEAFAAVSSHYLPHDLRHLRVATARSDTGRRDLEDLLSLPDLAAGALSEVLSLDPRLGSLVTDIMVPAERSTIARKALPIVDWLADNRSALKRLTLAIFKDQEAPAGFKTAFLAFHGLGSYPMFTI